VKQRNGQLHALLLYPPEKEPSVPLSGIRLCTQPVYQQLFRHQWSTGFIHHELYRGSVCLKYLVSVCQEGNLTVGT
jgi:hypothetical protein